MINPYDIKERQVLEFFRHEATIDEHAKAFAYMNCITLRDYTGDEQHVTMDPMYIVLQSDNDGIERGTIISWPDIELYMDKILDESPEDDIECLYCYLTDKY